MDTKIYYKRQEGGYRIWAMQDNAEIRTTWAINLNKCLQIANIWASYYCDDIGKHADIYENPLYDDSAKNY